MLATSLPNFISDSIPALKDLSLDWTVLLATIFLSALAAVIFGLSPALRISAPNLSTLVRESGVVSDRGGMRLGGLLVVLEITLTLVLLTGAGLMIKSFYKLVGGDQGFNPEGLITMRLSLPVSKYKEAAQVKSFIDNLIEKSRSTPLVQEVEEGVLAVLTFVNGCGRPLKPIVIPAV
jgi:putative ABC transport system permease protein